MNRNSISYFVWVLSFATTLLFSCSKEDVSDSASGKQVALSVSLIGINESDETTEITRGGSQTVSATQTVTVPAGNGMTLEATLERNAPVTTRGTTALAAGVKYRVIAFKEDDVSSSGYISYADYEMGTTGAIAGELHAPLGERITIIGYSLGTTASLPAFNKNSLDVGTNPATDDLLYTKFSQSISTGSTNVSLTLRHQFSLVTVIADATNLALDVRSINCSLSPNYSGTLNLVTGSLTAGAFAARSIFWGSIVPGRTITANPCTVFTNGGNSITLNISSVTIWYAIKSNFTTTFGSDVMLPGYKYTLRLNFKRADVVPILAVGLSWAPGNLVGSPNGDGTFSYSFSPTQEAYSGIWNEGDYWSWGQLDPTFLTSYSGNYSPSVDPCHRVNPAGTWRMPTIAELTDLMNAGYVWTTKNGVGGTYLGTTDVATANSNPDNYVFLPATGIRINSRTDSVNEFGCYWSTSLDTSGTYYLYFVRAFVSTSYENGNYGFAIRCVK